MGRATQSREQKAKKASINIQSFKWINNNQSIQIYLYVKMNE